MPKLLVIDSQAQQHELSFTQGDTLMEVLRGADFEEVEAICGGSCSCATCHVHVLESAAPMPPIEDDEALLLELADNYDESLSRLSCQIELTTEYAGTRIQLLSES